MSGPYGTSPVIESRWQTRQLVGDQQHALIVRVRPGFMKRAYQSSQRIDDGSPIYPPLIWEGHNHDCWKGVWTPTGPWIEVPNIEGAKWTRDFDVTTGGAKGTSTCTVVMDNIAFPEKIGVGGIYHAIARGYYSPERGFTPTNRTNYWPQDIDTGWRDVLNGGYQIELWEGYGSGADVQLKAVIDPVTNSFAPDSGALDRTWTGVVVDCDTEAHPDKITLTAQDFGILFTDQRLMGTNKAPESRTPVTFADRKKTQGEKKLSGPLQVSSGTVTNGVWRSADDSSPTDVEYIEITLPAGYYTEFFVAPTFDGEEMFVSLHLSGPGTLNHTSALPAGWVDLGLGSVPGGGPAYVRRVGTINSDPTQKWAICTLVLPGGQGTLNGFDVPDGSKLRLSFTRLAGVGGGNYAAGTQEVAAYQYGWDPLHPPNGAAPINAKGWILVEDASEVVRMLCIWAGFQEWVVEEFGWSLYAQLSYGEDKFFMDLIDDMLQQGLFIFYMGAPSNDDRSLGRPHFEHLNALDAPTAGTLEVRDTDTTEALDVKWNLADLPWVMRYRGAINDKGQTLFQDLSKRFMATYYPPWSGAGQYVALGSASLRSATQIRRVGPVHRHFTETMSVSYVTVLNSNEECLFACVMAAMQYCLQMVTGQFQIPGLSRLGLNDTVSVVDEASAVNSRLWVASVDSEHQMGEQGYWRMTVGGSLIDTPEMESLIADYNYALVLNRRHKSSF